MVHIVKLWETFSDYAENVRQGFYIEKDALDGKVEVRIVAGRLAYQTTLEDCDPVYDQIKEFLKVHGFTEIETSVDPDLFLR